MAGNNGTEVVDAHHARVQDCDGVDARGSSGTSALHSASVALEAVDVNTGELDLRTLHKN